MNHLNSVQQQAVMCPSKHILVVAGAGTGKTSVLTERAIRLVNENNLVFAVTFTNKAAGEMKNRIAKKVKDMSSIVVKTFHGFCFEFLKTHQLKAKLPEKWRVIDEDEQEKILLSIIGKERKKELKDLLNTINLSKDDGFRSKNSDAIEYQQYCDRQGLVDFGELLMRTYEVLKEGDGWYQFDHVLCDEFQDTNLIQYEILKLLSRDGSLFVVGDDDQSIYSWRGARIENILEFPQKFPNITVFKLEQNYRSTQQVLAIANPFIAQNMNRHGKNLWTQKNGDKTGNIITFNDEWAMGRWLMANLQQPFEENSVLYRNHQQADVIEQVLERNRIPYRRQGGLTLGERVVTKNIIAAMRLAENYHDDLPYIRLSANNGFTKASLDKIFDSIRNGNESLYAHNSHDKKYWPWHERLQQLSLETESMNSVQAIEYIENHFNIWGKEKDRAKDENVLTRVFALAENVLDKREFLDNFVLKPDDESEQNRKGVNLMTLHAAKGLEFDTVFYLFPAGRQGDEIPEEEIRLTFVGITRARKRVIFLAMNRNEHPNLNFIKEIQQNEKQQTAVACCNYDSDDNYDDIPF